MSTYSLKCIQENEEKPDKFKTIKRALGAAAIGGVVGGGVYIKAQNRIDLINQRRLQGLVKDRLLTKPSEFDDTV